MVRGTIVERSAEGNVSILTVTGDVRTFAAADIEFAGAAPSVEAAPVAPTAPVAADAPVRSRGAAAPSRDGGYDVRFEAARGDGRILRVHEVVGSANATVVGSGSYVANVRAFSFGAACALPCVLHVSGGSHRFALSLDDRDPVPGERTIDVSSDASFSAAYDDARPRRRRGIGIGAGLLLAGGALSIGGLTASIAEIDCEFDGVRCGAPPAAALYVPGLVLTVGGFVSLFVGLFSHDDADFEPLTVRF